MNATITTPTAENKHYLVAALENGTVIDHIPTGKAFFILRLLKLDNHHKQVSVGMHLSSAQMGSKDIIKVEGWELSPNEASQIAIFAPRATVNIIQDYRVIDKYVVKTPPSIAQYIICPNPNCITNHEKTSRLFYIESHRKESQLQCQFCEKVFSRNEINKYFL
jgi:aspartate carbamoyltransferase regulatory subunit